MKEDIENGLINCCITKDLSRLGRNAIDTGFYIETYFPKIGCRYIAVTDGYDSADGRSGGIMVSLKNMVNETIALEAGRKIRAYHNMLDKEGGFSGAHSPYGYLKAPNDIHRLVPDEYASEIVRRIFEMYHSGTGATAILKWLNENEILPPKRYFDSIGVGNGNMGGATNRWCVKNIKAILTNRVYCGDIVRGKYKTINWAKSRTPKADWLITENKHEAIISRELFDRVQEIRKNADKSQNKRYDTPKKENMFKGKIFCGHCGRSLERQRTSESIYKYRCSTRYWYAKEDCSPISIKETILIEKLLDMLRYFNIEITKKQAGEEIENGKSELLEVEAERRKYQRLLDGLYESLIANDITEDEYREIKSAYTVKITDLIAREKTLRKTERERTNKESMLTKASESLNAVYNSYELTTDIVDGIIEKIRVFEDKSIRVKFTFMDDEIPSREVDVYE
jgi:hypothetical protein